MISVVLGIAAALGVVAVLTVVLSCLVNDDCQRSSVAHRETGEGAPSPSHPLFEEAA
jgi:hypothetical protein